MSALACTLLMAACSAQPQGDAASRSDSAGVAIVVNDGRHPAWARQAGWTLAARPAIQVGNVLGSPEHQFFHVGHSRRLADGGIAVANTGFGDIRVFDVKGYYVRTLSLGADAAEKAPPLRVYETSPGDLLVVQGDHDPVVHPKSGQQILDHLGSEEKHLARMAFSRHVIVRGDGCEAVHARCAEFVAELARRLH